MLWSLVFGLRTDSRFQRVDTHTKGQRSKTKSLRQIELLFHWYLIDWQAFLLPLVEAT